MPQESYAESGDAEPANAERGDAERGEDDRGRQADRPQDIPVPGLKDILARVWRNTLRKNLSLVAGGVTYYMLLALFPALATLVSIYGLVADPAQVERTLNLLSKVIPASSQQLIAAELHHLASASNTALSAGAVVGLVISLGTASFGVSGMINALNITYDEEDQRSLFKFYLITVILTIGMIVSGVLALVLVAFLPAILASLGADPTMKWIALIVEWPLLMAFVMATLMVLYRFAPDREDARWEWITPGALTATLLWVGVSLLFTLYVANFNNYDATYGALGAVAVLLTWLWLSSYIVLLGAEINAESERQTRRDSTTGPPEPMGERGATVADTLGKARGEA
jgi:membrane protein